MNKEKRKRIEAAVCQIEEIMGEVAAIKDDEQEAFDNLPEGLQSSEKGDAMTSAIEALEGVESSLDEAMSQLQEIE